MRFHHLLLLFLFGLSPCLRAADPVASAAFTGGEQGRILIQAKINGQGPFPFVFDTGSVNILSLDLVNKLGIPVTGKQEFNAFGGTLETATALLDSIQIGDFAASNTVSLPHSQVTVIGGGPFTHSGPVGFLGWEFLAHLVVEIDYEHGRLNFYNPATYTYTGSGVRAPISLSGNLIAVPAQVFGYPGSMVLDSGNENNALVLFHRFTAQHHLDATTEAITGYGFGGRTRAMVTRAPYLEIAGLKIDLPLTNLSLDDSGIEAGTTDGNIGAPLLREFRWTYDVPHEVVYLEPDKWFHKPALEDHSGLVLDTRNDAAEVLFVYPNSPAARAGITIGDKLKGAENQSLTTDQWHDLLDAPTGKTVKIQINHEGKARMVSLTLGAYI